MAKGTIEVTGDDILSAMTTGKYPPQLNADGESLADPIAERSFALLLKRLNEHMDGKKEA